jgi:hypothetical protein
MLSYPVELSQSNSELNSPLQERGLCFQLRLLIAADQSPYKTKRKFYLLNLIDSYIVQLQIISMMYPGPLMYDNSAGI